MSNMTKESENDKVYDYDLEKITHVSLAKQLTFYKDKRFNNNGIFGSLFDTRKASKFGSPSESTLDIDKAENARMIILKPRMTE